MSKRRILWIFGAVLLIAICIRPAGAKREDVYSDYRTFVGIVNKVVENYVDEVDRKKLFEGACRGMLGTLDPYSQFIGPDVLDEFNDNTQGEFGGLGIEIDMRGGILTVITPIKGTPAYAAGVLAGDMIIEIEGKTTEGMTIHEAVNKLRGPVGTKVTITVIHEDSRKSEKITITRERIEIPTVEWEMVDTTDKIGYVHLKSFTKYTHEKTQEAIEALKKQGMKSLIMDLRNNPGGLFPSAIEVADLFLSKGVIVRTRGRDRELVKEVQATPPTIGDFPFVILINGGSASASEIVSAAIKDNGRGILVGEKTYGKATVQSVISVDLGEEAGKRIEGALKLTTARYYTPNDVSIDQKGVLPDIEIKMTPEQQLAVWRQERREFLRKQRREKAEEKPAEEPKEKPKDEGKDDNGGKDDGGNGSVEGKVKGILNNFDRGRLSVGEATDKIMSAVGGSDVAIAPAEPTEEAKDVQLQRAIDVLKLFPLVNSQLRAGAK